MKMVCFCEKAHFRFLYTLSMIWKVKKCIIFAAN